MLLTLLSKYVTGCAHLLGMSNDQLRLRQLHAEVLDALMACNYIFQLLDVTQNNARLGSQQKAFTCVALHCATWCIVTALYCTVLLYCIVQQYSTVQQYCHNFG
jgi:hypothetical protein